MGLKNLLEPSDPVEREMLADLDKIGLVAKSLPSGMSWLLRAGRHAITLGAGALVILFATAVWQRHNHWVFLALTCAMLVVAWMIRFVQRMGYRIHNALLESLCLSKYLDRVRVTLTRRKIASLPPEARPN